MKKIIAFIMTLVMVLGLSSVGVWAADATWQVEKPMSTARQGVTSIVMNGKIYVIGGSTTNYNNGGTNVVEIYDPATNTWQNGVPMLSAKMYMTASLVGNKIYVIGGIDPLGKRLNTMEIYDSQTNVWSTGLSLPQSSELFCSAVVDNKIYVVGLNTLTIYNIETNSWTPSTTLSFGFASPNAVVIDSKIYVCDGSKIQIYNTKTNTWSAGATKPNSTSDISLTVVGNKIYSIGGNKTPNNNVEIYDTVTNSWSTGSSINTGRSWSTATVVNDKIYVIGGQDNSGSLKSMESLQVGPTVTIPEAPASLTATGGNTKVDLSWGAVSGATSYTVKRSTTAGGPYTDIATGVTGTTYTDTDVTNGTTYYYVVTAVNTAGSSSNSNEASATPTAGSGGEIGSKALLVITMTNGLEKEYELTTAEINAFISWYDGKAAGSGAGYFKINKTFNLGPFLTRTDYLTFDKIQNFEVMQYQ